MNIRGTLLSLLIVCTFFSVVHGGQCTFKHEKTSLSAMQNEVTIECYDKGEKIGELCYVKIPLFPYYIVHSFFIKMSYRNKGYGSRLLNYACDYLTLQGASKVYVQPGPFEEQGLERVPVCSELLLQQLIAFYKKNHFVFANKVLQLVASLVYKCMDIEEDYHYLMVRTLQ